MPSLAAVELWVGRIVGAAGLLTLGIAVAAMLRSLRRPPGREEPRAAKVLAAPCLTAAAILFLGTGALLWRPIPLRLSEEWRFASVIAGAVVMGVGLGLYLWGLRTMGAMFGASTSFAVRLHADHRLVTTGPFAIIRHPMYLAVIATGLGGLLLYRTWAMLAFSSFLFGLRIRARREEAMLAQAFADEWAAYAARVPAWLPRLRRKREV